MDPTTSLGLLDYVAKFGPFGAVLVMWYVDSRRYSELLATYKADVAEVRRMYENNVSLVEGYQSVAGDLRDVVIMNTQAMTELGCKVSQMQRPGNNFRGVGT